MTERAKPVVSEKESFYDIGEGFLGFFIVILFLFILRDINDKNKTIRIRRF